VELRPPRNVKVGPHRYRVISDKDALMEAASGRTDRERLTICLDPTLAGSALADTLVHELVHACLAVVALGDDVEEQVALALGPGLLALLRDNPKLVKYLTT
jgi:hypothetical protein